MLRPYHHETDKDAVNRIWREIGWIEKGQEAEMDRYVACGRAWVAEIDGSAECLVCSAPGSMRYLAEDLPFSAITGVTTSRVARKRGLAGALLARVLKLDAEDGALVSGLGMFEQGFYDRLGFGTGGYELSVALDPSALKVDKPERVASRLDRTHASEMHAARLARARRHGGVNLTPEEITYAEAAEYDNAFGLGYCDGPNGELTHFGWFRAKKVENGPYHAELVFQNVPQFRELMALIGSMGDQVHKIRLREPAGIQLQDLVECPIRHARVTKGTDYAVGVSASAYWQARMLDVPACVSRTHLFGPPVKFNAVIEDPLASMPDLGWAGAGGSYVVDFGATSSATRGQDPELPVLTASIGAFTRLWLGVRPASGLAATDRLDGPRELLARLDATLRLPEPRPDWDF